MILVTAIDAGLSADPQTDLNYHLLKTIPVGGDGAVNSLTLDAQTRRLYVAHGSKVVVVDLEQDRVTGLITNTPGVFEFVPVDQYSVGFSSDGDEDRLGLIKLKTLRTRFKLKAGKNPGAIVYDSSNQLIYAFNRGDNSFSLYESDDGDPVSTTALAGKPAFAVLDPQAGRMYCNLEDKNLVSVIDTASHQVLKDWPIGPGESASGIALDTSHHRLFLGCHGNNRLEMMDSATGNVINSVPTGLSAGTTVFDADNQLVFSANGEGNVTIAHEDSPDTLSAVQTLTTCPGANSMALDPKSHNIYVAAADYASGAQLTPNAGEQPSAMVPGSVKILVYGR